MVEAKIMLWLIIGIIIVAVLIVAAAGKAMKINYSIGSGLFKHSENNLDEKEELSDKDYFDKDGLLK